MKRDLKTILLFLGILIGLIILPFIKTIALAIFCTIAVITVSDIIKKEREKKNNENHSNLN